MLKDEILSLVLIFCIMVLHENRDRRPGEYSKQRPYQPGAIINTGIYFKKLNGPRSRSADTLFPEH